METKQQELFGKNISLSTDKASTNAIRIVFNDLENTHRNRITKNYENLFSNLDELYEKADVVANEIRDQAIDQAMKFLAAHGLYEISEQQFFEQFMDDYDNWDIDFEPIAGAYEDMLEQTANLDAYRTARRKNRSKWVGLNERGVHQADAKNLFSNVSHGVFNLMAKGVTAIGNAIKKDEIYKNPRTLERVRDGMGDIVAAPREGTIEALQKLKPGSVYLYSDDEMERAAAIAEHVNKGRIPEAEILSALIRAAETFPYDRDVFVLLLNNCGYDSGRLDSAVEYFGLKPLDQEKKKLFEHRRRSTDLSNLEALNVHLPQLVTYSKFIGYMPFEQEAITLRETASRQAFDDRLQRLANASVEDIRVQSDEIRAYASELGLDGADSAIEKFLASACLREFNQETVKYSLESLEDLDQSLPLLKEYADRIGFDGFDAWTEATRRRIITQIAKQPKETKAKAISGVELAKNSKNEERSKPMSTAIVLTLIAAVLFGGYKGYTYFTAPSPTMEIVSSQPQKVLEQATIEKPVTPIENVPNEPAIEQKIQPIEQEVSNSLRPLSPAAEQAIRETYVEILDPTVQFCTDAKVAEFRKEMGEEALLRYDIYNEFAVDCGFNI